MNNAGRELRRRQLIQRRLRTQLNTIQNLVDDLLEGLARQTEPLLHPPYKYAGLTYPGWFIDYPGLPGSQPPLRTHRIDVREGIARG